jgi:hypothetical protein
MPRPSEGPRLYLQRARDREGSSRTAWCPDYWQGGVPGPGVVVEGVIESNKPSKPPGMYENGTKMAGFLHLLTFKMPKTLFLNKKVIN